MILSIHAHYSIHSCEQIRDCNATLSKRESPGLEIYRNQEVYQHHLTTPHFQTCKQGTLHMVKSLNLLGIKPLDLEFMS